jgi:hypothetical protein
MGDLHGDRIGDEFGVQYIIKAGENEYQRIADIAATKASLYRARQLPPGHGRGRPRRRPLRIPRRYETLGAGPHQPRRLRKGRHQFLPHRLRPARPQTIPDQPVRKAFDYGLTEAKALDALTKIPATLIGVYDKVGSLDAGKLANFLITTGPVFAEKTSIVENWIQGKNLA